MATIPNIKIDPETVKNLVKSMSKEKFVMDPHGRSTPRRMSDRFEYDQEYHIKGPLSVSPTTVNHCQLGGSGGMSGCYACHYSDDKSKNQCQKACSFYEKSRFHLRCMWETYGEFCWSTKAQDDRKAKGF